MSNSPKRALPLKSWERSLFQAGYCQALSDAALVIVRRARPLIGVRPGDDDLAGPLLDAGAEISKLGEIVQRRGDERIH